jgi:carboxyl-terminal processing protease
LDRNDKSKTLIRGVVLKQLSVIVLFVILLFSESYSQPAGEDAITFQAKKFRFILENAVKYHADSVDIVKVSDAAFSSMLKAMDKQSTYFSVADNIKRKENSDGKSVGIGIDFYSIRDTLLITEIEDNSPAKKAGILSGDRILFIDGKKFLSKTRDEGMTALRGDTGTKVSLIVKREGGNALLEYEVLRKELPLIGITDAFLLPKSKVAYVKLSRFSENCYEEMEKSIKQLGVLDALVFDLRDNGGGYIKAVQDIAGMFFRDSVLLTKTKSRDTNFTFVKYTKPHGQFKDVPVVVLINNNSASGSEMLAGAIQDYDRGLIIGDISYGKGSVQKTFDMIDSSAFKITVASYCTPLGRPIENDRLDKKVEMDEAMKVSLGKETYDNIQKSLAKYNLGKKMDVYKTKSGRSIVGGGAIFPDYFAKQDTVTDLTKFLKARGIFLEYAFNYKRQNEKMILDEYGSDYDKFMLEYKLTDQMVKDFYTLAVARNIWNNDMFAKDKPYILNYMKAMIAYTFWGTKAYNKVLLNNDQVMVKAIKSLVEAKAMLQKMEK